MLPRLDLKLLTIAILLPLSLLRAKTSVTTKSGCLYFKALIFRWQDGSVASACC